MTLEAGTTQINIPFEIFENIINEELENFEAVLSSPTNGLRLGTNYTSIVYITDNDGKPFS